MPKKRYNAKEIIHKLREAEVLLGKNKTVAEVCKQLGVTDQFGDCGGDRGIGSR